MAYSKSYDGGGMVADYGKHDAKHGKSGPFAKNPKQLGWGDKGAGGSHAGTNAKYSYEMSRGNKNAKDY